MTVERLAWWRWFLPSMIICLAWNLATPRNAPSDEWAHINRAVAVGRGQLGGKTRFIGALGSITEVRVPGTYYNMISSSCFTAQPEVPAECGENVPVDPKIRPTLTIAGRYPPLYYLLLAVPTRIFRPVIAVYAMRFIASLLCAAFLASAFRSAQLLGRWAVLGVAVAITPTAVMLASVVNPSGLEIASAVALWTSSAALARGSAFDGRLTGRAAIAYAFFANARGLSLPMALAALLVPMSLASKDRLLAIARSRLARTWGALIAFASATALAWALLRGRIPPVADERRITIADGIVRSWTLFEESVASFGLDEIRDLTAILLFFLLWTVLLLVGVRYATKRDRVVLSGLLVASLGFPIAVSLVRPPPIYTIWQGRYSLPMWIGLPIIAGTVAAGRRVRDEPAKRWWWALAGALVLGHVVAFATAAHRYAVGSRGKVLYFLDPIWTGPAHPVLPLVLVFVGTAALAREVVSAAAGQPLSSPDRDCARPGDPVSAQPGPGQRSTGWRWSRAVRRR